MLVMLLLYKQRFHFCFFFSTACFVVANISAREAEEERGGSIDWFIGCYNGLQQNIPLHVYVYLLLYYNRYVFDDIRVQLEAYFCLKQHPFNQIHFCVTHLPKNSCKQGCQLFGDSQATFDENDNQPCGQTNKCFKSSGSGQYRWKFSNISTFRSAAASIILEKFANNFI